MSRRQDKEKTTMNRILLALAAAATLSPLAAHAQNTTGSSTVTLTADVQKACVLGQPSSVTLNLSTLTGSDGRITTALAGAASAASTTINNAWCNAPSTLTVAAEPMNLGANAPAYSTPAGFARLVTYNASLTGWPSSVTVRPLGLDNSQTTNSTESGTPHAAELVLNISALAALNASGSAENPSAVLEAGSYAGQVVIGVAVQ